MQYEKLLQKLFNLNRFSNFKYNLNNVQTIANYFGNPEKNLDIIHITGTNGKGSTAYKLSRILQDNKKNTGLFISPHLSTFRERITINQELIEKEFLIDFLQKIFEKMEQNKLQGSFFEVLTVLAYKYFDYKKVDIACMEVGIGGKLDCTNIIDKNLLSIITSISYDHINILGHSLEEIAINKAGIIKKNNPCVIGPEIKQDWLISNICKDLNSNFYKVDNKGLKGYFEINKAIVRKSIDVINLEHNLNLKINENILEQNLSGRMEKVPKNILKRLFNRINKNYNNLSVYTDVGHNTEAIENVIKSLTTKEKKLYQDKKFIFVYGTSKAKNSYNTLNLVKNHNSKVYLIQGDNYRSKDINILEKEAKDINLEFNIINKGNIKKTLNHIFEQDLEDTCIVVFGSFFIMEEARDFFGYEDEKDFFFLNEMNSF